MTEDNFFKESVRRAQAQQRVIWTVIALWLIATLAVCIFYGVATQKLKVASQEAQKQLETIKKQLSDTQSAWRAQQDYVSGIRSESAKQNEAFQVTLQGFESDASKSKASLCCCNRITPHPANISTTFSSGINNWKPILRPQMLGNSVPTLRK